MLLANLEQSKKDIGSLERTYVKISPLTCINGYVVDIFCRFPFLFYCYLLLFAFRFQEISLVTIFRMFSAY
jgi:hypothetical protein